MISSFSPLFSRLLFVFVVVVLCSPCDARRPRAYIHIGPHKAGSTTVQSVIAAVHDKLPPTIHSPLNNNAKGLSGFAKTIMKNGDLEPYSPLLYSISRKEKDIILSAEGFDKPKNINSTNKFAEIFKDYDVTIIAYLREPMAHLTSYWLQWNCGKIPTETLPVFLNTTLDNLRVLSSLPPPFELPEVDMKKKRKQKKKARKNLKKTEKKEKEREDSGEEVEVIVKVEEEIGQMTGQKDSFRVIDEKSDQIMEFLKKGGGVGWELFRTLDLYRHSLNVTMKREKEEGERREEEGEGENKIVLIDFDGVLASGKTLAGVLLNEVIGLEGINTEDVEKNTKHELVTAVNIGAFYTKEKREGGSIVPCEEVGDRIKSLRGKLEARGGLKACSEVIDLDKTKREMDDYFGKKLEESGFEVLYGGKGKKWTGIKDCYVVDEEVGKTVPWELDNNVELPKERQKKVREWRPKEQKRRPITKAMRKVEQKAEEKVKQKAEEKVKQKAEEKVKEKVEEGVELMETLGEVRELVEKLKEKQVELEERLEK